MTIKITGYKLLAYNLSVAIIVDFKHAFWESETCYSLDIFSLWPDTLTSWNWYKSVTRRKLEYNDYWLKYPWVGNSFQYWYCAYFLKLNFTCWRINYLCWSVRKFIRIKSLKWKYFLYCFGSENRYGWAPKCLCILSKYVNYHGI